MAATIKKTARQVLYENANRMLPHEQRLLKKLKEVGITDEKFLAAALANAAKETGLYSSRSEGGYYSKAEDIYNTFNRHFKDLKHTNGTPYTKAEKLQYIENKGLVGNAKKLFNFVYKGENGNTEDDDGYNFRGSGDIQITGRDGFKKAYELVKKHRQDKGLPAPPNFAENPDLLRNDNELSAEASALWFKDKVYDVFNRLPEDQKEVIQTNKGGILDFASLRVNAGHATKQIKDIEKYEENVEDALALDRAGVFDRARLLDREDSPSVVPTPSSGFKLGIMPDQREEFIKSSVQAPSFETKSYKVKGAKNKVIKGVETPGREALNEHYLNMLQNARQLQGPPAPFSQTAPTEAYIPEDEPTSTPTPASGGSTTMSLPEQDDEEPGYLSQFADTLSNAASNMKTAAVNIGSKLSDAMSSTAQASPMPESQPEIINLNLDNSEPEIINLDLGEQPDTQNKQSATTPSVQPPKSTEPETGKLKAVGLGAAQGLTFGFADELEALARSTFGKKTYQESVEQARKKYEKAAEDRPGAYYGAEIGTGVLSTFIPVAGQLGAAGVAARAGKAAKDIYAAKKGVDVASKAARGVELATAGAVGGGLGSIGASEADLLSKQTPEAALELGTDIATGALGGATLGKAGQVIAESPTTQKVMQRLKDSAVTKKAKEIRDAALSGGRDQVEQGRIFIGKPETVKEVEDAFKSGGFESVDKTRANVRDIIKQRGQESREINKLSNEYRQTEKQLSQEISDIKRGAEVLKDEQALEVRKQTSGLQKEYDDVKQALSDLSPKIDAAEAKIKQQVETMGKSLDNQSAKAIQGLYENQLDKINSLAKQRDIFRDKSLSQIAADQKDAQALQDAVKDMYSMYKDEYNTAIKPVFVKIVRSEPRYAKMMQIVDDPNAKATLEGSYTKADMVKMLENAKRELYTPISDRSPTGIARREAYQILNQKLGQIAPDEYTEFNRQLNKLMTTRDVLEDSPLMKGYTVTRTGKVGGETAETRYLATTKRPDIEKLPPDYLQELQSKGYDINLLQKQEEDLRRALTKDELMPLELAQNEMKIKSNSLKRQIREIKDKLQISSAEERRKLNEVLSKKTDDLNLYRNKMTSKLTKMREDLAEKYADKINQARETAVAAQIEARKKGAAYSTLAESPITQDQLNTMIASGATGRYPIPLAATRLLRPTPMNRIRVYNAINRMFNNPSLAAAISPRVGQAITESDILSLSKTHSVDPGALREALQEEGIPVQ